MLKIITHWKLIAFAVVLSAISPAPLMASEELIFAPPADWVKPTAKKYKREVSNKKLAAVIVQLDQQVKFGEEADEIYVATKILVQTPQGLAAMGTISIPWSPDSTEVTVHRLHLLRDDKIIDVLGNGQTFTILRRETNLESAALDGVLTATIQPEDMQVGDIIDMAATYKTRDPVLKGHSELSLTLQNNLPETSISFDAIWPSDRVMRWQKTEFLDEPKLRDKGGFQYLSLDLDGTSNLTSPKKAPARFIPQRTIEFTDYDDWGRISKLMAPLYVKASVITPGSDLAAEVAKIRAANSDPEGRASAALKLVQDRVRYVYRGMNTGNLVPADAMTTWQRKYGDCKGKTALLIAILQALDISAEPAVVSTVGGDGLDEKLPMVRHFDHILVRADIDGQILWLDGTRLGDGDVKDVPVPGFHWALPVRSDGASLEKLVQKPLVEPSEFTHVHLDAAMGTSRPALAEVEKLFRGQDAISLKLVFDQLSGEDLEKALRSYWEGEYDFMTPEEFENDYDAATGVYRLFMSGTAELDWSRKGYELDGARVGWTDKLEREEGPDNPNHDAPVTRSFPYYIAHKQTIVLPHEGEGFTVDGENVEETVGGYVFNRKVSITGDELLMESSQRSLGPEIPWKEAKAAAEKITELRKVRVYAKPPLNYRLTSSEVQALDKEEPQSAGEYMRRGIKLMSIGKVDEAIESYTSGLKLDPDHAYSLANRGLAYAQKKEIESAKADFDKAESIDPEVHVIYHGRATLALAENDYSAAIAALTKAMDLKEGNIWALGQRAAVHYMEENYVRALVDAQTIVDQEPTSILGYMMKSQSLNQMKLYDDALETIDAAPTNSSDQKFELVLMRAELFVKKGEDEKAIAEYQSYRENRKADANAMNALCWGQATIGFDLEQALADCDVALKKDPKSAAFLDSRGLVLLRLGRHEDSIKSYNRSLKIWPDLAVALFGRGLAKIEHGDIEAGQADIAAARDLFPKIDIEYKRMGLSTP